MTVLAPAAKRSRRHHRPHLHTGHLLACGVVALAAITLVGYLLWPTWRTGTPNDASTLPVDVGGALFNVPAEAFRMKVQRRSGPQDRIDLVFAYPSLAPPDAPKHVSADTVEVTPPPIDRIFLSIGAHGGTLPPDERARTIYPRYLEARTETQDGLTGRAFRETSPYRNEDLFTADTPAFAARCMRDDVTPGMCLSERRIAGADLTFRFPRAWLAQWRDVAGAMDRLTAHLHGRAN